MKWLELVNKITVLGYNKHAHICVPSNFQNFCRTCREMVGKFTYSDFLKCLSTKLFNQEKE